ncbi:RepB family plasmid replication initiator protein [Helicobacter sp. L8]|uniref:RepB family plasmid replication initiator protein n=1 Tax=Helicobacter sp. L8 TaxID=2316078 RepID=UPI000EAB71BC|nr:RepB family plasmid replication initiator protein [Helicobacter sp. L8]
MDKEHPLYRRLKDLRDVTDALKVLELQNADNPAKLEKLFAKKTEIVKEMVAIILENEAIWGEGELNISGEAIKSLKHSTNLIVKLEKVTLKTTSHDLEQDLRDGIKECIKSMESVLTTWVEWIDPKNKLQDLVPITELQQSIVKHQSSQTTSRKPSKERTKETTEQESPKDLNIIAKKPTEIETQNLASVDKTPTKAPVLAKDLSIANRGQIVMHNNIYKVNLGTLSELENNLFFGLFNRLKDKKDTIIRFTPKELKTLAGDPYMPNERLYKLTLGLFNKGKVLL